MLASTHVRAWIGLSPALAPFCEEECDASWSGGVVAEVELKDQRKRMRADDVGWVRFFQLLCVQFFMDMTAQTGDSKEISPIVYRSFGFLDASTGMTVFGLRCL